MTSGRVGIFDLCGDLVELTLLLYFVQILYKVECRA